MSDESFEELETRLVKEIKNSPNSLTFEEQLMLFKPIPITEDKISFMISGLQSFHSMLAVEPDFIMEGQRCCVEINKLIASLEYMKIHVHNRENSMKGKSE